MVVGSTLKATVFVICLSTGVLASCFARAIDDINYLIRAGVERHAFFNQVDGLEEPSDAINIAANLDVNFRILDYRSRFVIGGKRIVEKDRTVRSGFYWNELYWLTEFADFSLTVGKAKQHWGIMETRNLVDVINTTDYLHGYNSMEKLAQNMVKIGVPFNIGQVDVYLLEGGESREFFESATRFEPIRVVNDPRYSDHTSANDIDVAARYWYYNDNLEIAYTFFKGTGRTPLIIDVNGENVPYYYEVLQHGLEVLVVDDRLLYKLEAVAAIGDGQENDFIGASFGLEYAMSRFAGRTDLALVGEYHIDHKESNSAAVSFDDYVMIGGLVTFNDLYLSSFRLGATFQRDDIDNYFYSMEGDFGLDEKIRLKASGTYAGSKTIPSYLPDGRNSYIKPLKYISLVLEYAF